MFKVISGTLLANRNTIEFTDETISNNSIFEVYADQPDVIPVSVTVGGTTASITFDSKASVNTGIKVLVNNIEGEYTPSVPIPDLDYHDNTSATGQAIGYFMDYSGSQPTITNVYNGITDDMLVPTDTTLGGVLYHASTGNTWKKLDASNIDYDSGSTIYSAMGDVDDLETESKNLVGAVNEVFQSVSDGKELLADAITDKGVTTSASDTFTTMAQHIAQISSGGSSPIVAQFDGMSTTYTSTNVPLKWIEYPNIEDISVLNDTDIKVDKTGEFTFKITCYASGGGESSLGMYKNNVLVQSKPIYGNAVQNIYFDKISVTSGDVFRFMKTTTPLYFYVSSLVLLNI